MVANKKIVFFIMLIFSWLTMTVSYAAIKNPRTFSQAKKAAAIIYSNHRETFYCGCRYNKHKKVKWKSCGYKPRKNPKRASRIEWEHITPAAALGNTRQCWREPICKKKNGKKYKGRKCCEKVDPTFRAMESDLMNLVPAIGEVNGNRSDFSFTELGAIPHQYGRCQMVINFKQRKAQPPPSTRGFIARTYFYMHKTYGIPISKKQQTLFAVWDRQYPATSWEKERHEKIQALKKKSN